MGAGPIAPTSAALRNAAIAGVLLVVATQLGCAPTRMLRGYSGPARPPETVALVELHWAVFGWKLSLEKLDGVQVREFSWWHTPSITEVELIPGWHTLEVSFVFDTSKKSTTNAVVRFDAQAGQTYRLLAAEVPEGFWAEASRAVFGGQGRWTAWVVDTTTGQVVGGQQTPAS